jgi:hypothetical protein
MHLESELPAFQHVPIDFLPILAKPLIETVSRNNEKGFFQVRIGTIATVISIVVLSVGDGRYVTI